MAGMKFDSKSFNPQAFGKYIENVPDLKRNELLNSKALVSNSTIRELFGSQTGSYYATIPMFGNLSNAEPDNYDGETDINSDSTKTFEQSVIVYGRAKGWVEKDFSYDITSGVDFMSNVAKQVSKYWENVDQDILLKILEGMFASEQTNGFNTAHTFDITGEIDNTMTATTLNNAVQKACGSNKNIFTMAIMHSQVATNLENLNLLNHLKYTDENGIQRDLSLATWNGRSVIIDDSLPTTTSDEGTNYTTYILGEGAFSYENLGAKVPYEMSRDPRTNGGEDTLYSRQRKVIAPKGFSYTKANQKSKSPTNEEFADGSNWALVSDSEGNYFDHKAIPVARIISRG